jgi:hypothetical protein
MPPPPIPRRKENSTVWIAVTVSAIAMFVLAIGAFIAFRPAFASFIRGFQQATRAPAQFSAYDDAGVALASKPVIVPASSTTAWAVTKKKRAFRERNYLDAYQQNGDHSKPWDADATNFLASWLQQNYGGNLTNTVDVRKTADQLVSEGCDDPLVLTIAGVEAVEWFEARDRLKHARDAYVNSKYKAYPQFYATLQLAAHLRKTEEQTNYDAEATALFKKALADGSIGPGDLDDVAETLVDGWGESFFYRQAPELIDAAKGAGPQFRWLALTLNGVEEIVAAWNARGNGFANTVTDNGEQKFETDSQNARRDLEEAWKLHPEWPMAPERALYACLGLGNLAEQRLWFDRAVAAQIDYMPAWKNFLWALRPRWYGSVKAMRAFGITALNTRRFDTDVPYELSNAIWDIEEESGDGHNVRLYGRSDFWPYVQRMEEGYINDARSHQDSTRENNWRGNYAILAFLGHQYETARQQFEADGWQPPYKMFTWKTDLSLIREEVAARTGLAALGVRQAEHARDQERFDDAFAQYTKLAQTDGLDPRSTAFIKERLASLALAQKLASGKEVDFLPLSDDDPNWVAARGSFVRQPDGSIEVSSGPTGSSIYCHTPVGGDFEVSGDFDVKNTSNGDFQAGLLIGWPEPEGGQFWSFRIKTNKNEGQVVEYNWDWGMTGVKHKTTVHPDHNSFTYRLHGGFADASLNGAPIIVHQKKPGYLYIPSDQFTLGLGAYNDMNNTTIRYYNIKVRKLNPSPNTED